jgi:hypothetical protein
MKCVLLFLVGAFCWLKYGVSVCIDHSLGLYYCVFDFQQHTVRAVLCSRVTQNIPFVQQFIHYMSKQDIVDYTVYSAQAMLEVHDASGGSMPLILHVAPRTEKFTCTA